MLPAREPDHAPLAALRRVEITKIDALVDRDRLRLRVALSAG
jgi:hypothetical protein